MGLHHTKVGFKKLIDVAPMIYNIYTTHKTGTHDINHGGALLWPCIHNPILECNAVDKKGFRVYPGTLEYPDLPRTNWLRCLPTCLHALHLTKFEQAVIKIYGRHEDLSLIFTYGCTEDDVTQLTADIQKFRGTKGAKDVAWEDEMMSQKDKVVDILKRQDVLEGQFMHRSSFLRFEADCNKVHPAQACSSLRIEAMQLWHRYMERFGSDNRDVKKLHQKLKLPTYEARFISGRRSSSLSRKSSNLALGRRKSDDGSEKRDRTRTMSFQASEDFHDEIQSILDDGKTTKYIKDLLAKLQHIIDPKDEQKQEHTVVMDANRQHPCLVDDVCNPKGSFQNQCDHHRIIGALEDMQLLYFQPLVWHLIWIPIQVMAQIMQIRLEKFPADIGQMTNKDMMQFYVTQAREMLHQVIQVVDFVSNKTEYASRPSHRKHGKSNEPHDLGGFNDWLDQQREDFDLLAERTYTVYVNANKALVKCENSQFASDGKEWEFCKVLCDKFPRWGARAIIQYGQFIEVLIDRSQASLKEIAHKAMDKEAVRQEFMTARRRGETAIKLAKRFRTTVNIACTLQTTESFDEFQKSLQNSGYVVLKSRACNDIRMRTQDLGNYLMQGLKQNAESAPELTVPPISRFDVGSPESRRSSSGGSSVGRVRSDHSFNQDASYGLFGLHKDSTNDLESQLYGSCEIQQSDPDSNTGTLRFKLFEDNFQFAEYLMHINSLKHPKTGVIEFKTQCGKDSVHVEVVSKAPKKTTDGYIDLICTFPQREIYIREEDQEHPMLLSSLRDSQVNSVSASGGGMDDTPHAIFVSYATERAAANTADAASIQHPQRVGSGGHVKKAYSGDSPRKANSGGASPRKASSGGASAHSRKQGNKKSNSPMNSRKKRNGNQKNKRSLFDPLPSPTNEYISATTIKEVKLVVTHRYQLEGARTQLFERIRKQHASAVEYRTIDNEPCVCKDTRVTNVAEKLRSAAERLLDTALAVLREYPVTNTALHLDTPTAELWFENLSAYLRWSKGLLTERCLAEKLASLSLVWANLVYEAKTGQPRQDSNTWIKKGPSCMSMMQGVGLGFKPIKHVCFTAFYFPVLVLSFVCVCFRLVFVGF